MCLLRNSMRLMCFLNSLKWYFLSRPNPFLSCFVWDVSRTHPHPTLATIFFTFCELKASPRDSQLLCHLSVLRTFPPWQHLLSVEMLDEGCPGVHSNGSHTQALSQRMFPAPETLPKKTVKIPLSIRHFWTLGLYIPLLKTKPMRRDVHQQRFAVLSQIAAIWMCAFCIYHSHAVRRLTSVKIKKSFTSQQDHLGLWWAVPCLEKPRGFSEKGLGCFPSGFYYYF